MRPMTRQPRAVAAALIGARVVALLGVVLLTGCVSDEKSARPLADQPVWVRPTNLILNVEQPEDRNSDGYDDTIFVTVYVFDADFREQSIRVDCSYVFMLVDADGANAMEWNVPPEVVNSGYRLEAPGPMLRLRLTIPQERAMVLGGKPYTLLARLLTSEGQSIESSGGTSFTLRQKGR